MSGLLVLAGVCLAGTEEAASSLVDVISPTEHARLLKVLEGAQPYEDVRTAYLIVKALHSLGFNEANKLVSLC